MSREEKSLERGVDKKADMFGPSLSETLRIDLSLGGKDPRDQLLLEMAAEIDNLAEDRRATYKAQSKAAISSRRFSALKDLLVLLLERDKSGYAKSKAAVIAETILVAKKAMKDSGLRAEQIETIIQVWIQGLDEGEKKRQKGKLSEDV